MLTIKEHKSSSYAPRTYHNAAQGVTFAIAVDFTTAGERLTHKAAGNKIAQYHYETDWIESARGLYTLLKQNNSNVINIAGNGIYTYAKYKITQEEINQYVFKIINLVKDHWTIDKIVSGGQTGADLAGLVAAVALNIDCEGTWPKGYKMRFEDGIDVNNTPENIQNLINEYVNKLNRDEA